MGVPTEQLLQGLAITAPVAGGYVEGQGLRQQAQAGAAAARYNADLAKLQGRENAASIRRQGQQELGRERVILANSGLRMEGTPLSFLARQAGEIEREAANAEIAARQTARLENARAKSLESAGRTQAGTSLLTGALGSATTAYRLRYGGG